MKIRQGFVSNSSSSASVAIYKKEDFMKVFNNLKNTFQKGIISQMMDQHLISEAKIFDNECIIMELTHGNYDWIDSFYLDEDRYIEKDAENFDNSIYEAFDEFEEKLLPKPEYYKNFYM